MIAIEMMRRGALRIFLLAIFCAGPSRAAITPPTADTPPLDAIVAKTLAKADTQQKALRSMQFDQVATVEQLNDRDQTTKREVLQMVMRPGGHPSMQVISAKGDNLPTNPDEVKKQGREVEGNKQNFTLRSLVNRFTLTLAGEEQIDGERAYVIGFTPKANQPYRDETEKVVDQLQGHIWVSARTFNVLQTEAVLAHPVSVAWFVAKIPQLDFHYAMLTDTDAGFAPCQVKITLQVRAFFVGYHVRQTIDMANFRGRVDAKPPG